MIVGGHVDAAVIGRRLFILPGEVSWFIKAEEKSAEVIVAADTSRAFKGATRRFSQSSEGLNIELFQMLHGGVPAMH